jgi:hypothetical protein
MLTNGQSIEGLKKVRVWHQTRYALTKGIVRIAEFEITDDGEAVRHGGSHLSWQRDRIGFDIFDTLEAAQADQRHRARKAIVSAKRTIAKMEKLILKTGGPIDG